MLHLYLAADESAIVTSHTFAIDGGLSDWRDHIARPAETGSRREAAGEPCSRLAAVPIPCQRPSSVLRDSEQIGRPAEIATCYVTCTGTRWTALTA